MCKHFFERSQIKIDPVPPRLIAVLCWGHASMSWFIFWGAWDYLLDTPRALDFDRPTQHTHTHSGIMLVVACCSMWWTISKHSILHAYVVELCPVTRLRLFFVVICWCVIRHLQWRSVVLFGKANSPPDTANLRHQLAINVVSLPNEISNSMVISDYILLIQRDLAKTKVPIQS